MNIQLYHLHKKERFQFSFLNACLLVLVIVIPLSCTAQKNILRSISSAKRSDNKGHVIRFHLRKKVSSFDFSQPQAYLVQLELHGQNITTHNVQLYNQSNIIKNIDYYTIDNGIGVDIFLKKNGFYKAAAYPDGASKDLLVGLTKTSADRLTAYIKRMNPFRWSDAPPGGATLAGNKKKKNAGGAVDTTYQKIKNKIKFDTVVLDAGHGGQDVGAIGYHHTYEKNVTLAIAKKVGGYINKYLPDVKVVYTRKDDHLVGAQKNPDVTIMQSLIERGRIANRAGGDLFVSIHCNSARSRQAHGTETYFLGLERSKTALNVMKRENNIVGPVDANAGKKLSQEDLIIYELANSGYIANSERLAGRVQSQFKDRAGRRSRGVKQARFVVLYHASMPAILIETGFITNPGEQQFLTSEYGQNIIASAIFRAIRNYKVQFEKSQHLKTK